MSGEVIVWCDPLCDGPTPSGITRELWQQIRARYLSESTGQGVLEDQALKFLDAQDTNLEKFHSHDEVVLWFDACLFDQAILIRQLNWFAHQDLRNTQLCLICIGDFPGFKRFRGLGELNPQQLSTLLHTRHKVSDTELHLAQRAWASFCAPDPLQIEAFMRDDSSSLPFLSDALRRHLEQFPYTVNGLSRLENEIVQVVSSGHTKLGEIFCQHLRWKSDHILETPNSSTT